MGERATETRKRVRIRARVNACEHNVATAFVVAPVPVQVLRLLFIFVLPVLQLTASSCRVPVLVRAFVTVPVGERAGAFDSEID